MPRFDKAAPEELIPRLPYSSVTLARKKVVTFGLSEPEYDQMVAVGEISGNNLSDFARTAVLRTADPFCASGPALADGLLCVEQRFNLVLLNLERVGCATSAHKEGEAA